MTTVQVESVRDVPLSGDFVEAVAFMVVRFGATVKMPLRFETDITIDNAEKELNASFEGKGVRVRIEVGKSSLAKLVALEREKAGMPRHPGLTPFAYFEPGQP